MRRSNVPSLPLQSVFHGFDIVKGNGRRIIFYSKKAETETVQIKLKKITMQDPGTML
jgi:hypothetical protein